MIRIILYNFRLVLREKEEPENYPCLLPRAVVPARICIKWVPRALSHGSGRPTTRIHLVSRLRMSGVPPLPLYAFMDCIGTAVRFCL